MASSRRSSRNSFGDGDSGEDSEEEWTPGGGARARGHVRRISSSSSDGDADASFATATSDDNEHVINVIDDDEEEINSFVTVRQSLAPGQLSPLSDTSSDILIGPSPPTEDEDDEVEERGQVIGSTPTSSRSLSLFGSTSNGGDKSNGRSSSSPPRNERSNQPSSLSGSKIEKSQRSPSSVPSSTKKDRSQQRSISSSASSPPANAGSFEIKKRTDYSGGSSTESKKPDYDHNEISKEKKTEPSQAKPRKFGIMTSTPLVAGGSKATSSNFNNLNMTAIPGVPRLNVSLEAILDESLHNDLQNNTNWRSSKYGNNSTDKSDDETVMLVPSSTSKKAASNADDDIEDTINAGVEKISLGANKTFNFKKAGVDARAAGGATCSNYFDEEEGDGSADISANFELEGIEEDDSGHGDSSDIQVVYHEKPNIVQVSSKEQEEWDEENIFSDSSAASDDDLQILTEKFKKLPLGKKESQVEQPPIEPYTYDPQNVKNEDFYGDVRRTVTMLANSIEAMPMPEDEVDLDQYLPRGLIPLYDHQKYGLRWLTWRESQFPGGGILADEMGLGKTIMIIALIMKSKMDGLSGEKQKENWVDQDIGNCTPSQATLVVCPMGCLLQWSEEISSKGKGLRVALYHGAQRAKSVAQLAQADVVLTTYGTIGAEMPKDEGRMGKSPLKRIYWKRIVLDESHTIRNPKTVSAVAIHKLAARYRWAVTGTPVHNRPEDFFSIVKFLRMVPFDELKVWDFWIGLKKLKGSKEARDRLHIIAKALILRRTKDEVHKAGGNVKAIPPKIVEVVKIDLPENEKQAYEHLMKYAKELFKNFLKDKEQREREMQGAAMTYTAERKKRGKQLADDVGDVRFSHLFALIMRLRQCSVLPALIKTMLEEEEVDDDDSFDENLEEHIISKRNPVFDDYYESAKIKKVLEDLEELRDQAKQEGRRMDKVVIVSSWTKLLEIINQHLRRRSFSSVFITGKEKSEERRDAQKAFNRPDKSPQIALLSLQAGGVGINLVGGNYVFFVEPHWNPMLELQAQDRVHRFGQEKDVFIRRYITNGSIEDRILELQEMKMDLAEGVLNSNKKSGGGGLSVGQMKLLFEVSK